MKNKNKKTPSNIFTSITKKLKNLSMILLSLILISVSSSFSFASPPTYTSCNDIANNVPGSTSGTYTIDPDGAGGESPFQVYCDMESYGGGWTLVWASIGNHDDWRMGNGGGANKQYWFSTGGTTTINSTTTKGKSLAYDLVGTNEIMLETDNNDSKIISEVGSHASFLDFIGSDPGTNDGGAAWNDGFGGTFPSKARQSSAVNFFENDWIKVLVGDGTNYGDYLYDFCLLASRLSDGDWSGDQCIGSEWNNADNTGDWYRVWVRDTKLSSSNDTRISAGHNYSIVLKEDGLNSGNAFTFGNNDYGQLANGTTTDTSFYDSSVINSIKEVDAGQFHSLYLADNGTVLAAGYNNKGQLGDGTTTDALTPVSIMSGIKEVSAGGYHSLMLNNNGFAFSTGLNEDGQLGDGTIVDKSTPVQVITGIKNVSAGYYHSAFLKISGDVYTSGRNTEGQLGNGTTVNASAPIFIMSGVKEVSAGGFHTLFLKTNGDVYAVGDNTYGQLGNGTVINASTPVLVMQGVAHISAGEFHSLFIKTNGDAYSAGFNSNGQLANGDTNNQSTPIYVLDGVSNASAGGEHSIFLMNNGDIYTAGNGTNYELGNGSQNSNTPLYAANLNFGGDTVPAGGGGGGPVPPPPPGGGGGQIGSTLSGIDVFLDILPGEVSIFAPETISFGEIESQRSTGIITVDVGNITGVTVTGSTLPGAYFGIMDLKSSNNGYAVQLSSDNFILGSDNNVMIPKENVKIILPGVGGTGVGQDQEGIFLLDGELPPEVLSATVPETEFIIPLTIVSRTEATTPATGRLGMYGIQPIFNIYIPKFQQLGEYTSTFELTYIAY